MDTVAKPVYYRGGLRGWSGLPATIRPAWIGWFAMDRNRYSRVVSRFLALAATLWLLATTPILSQQVNGKTRDKDRAELLPRRPECGILFPERDERHDVARLVRADQFLTCERDGFPKTLAPPWEETDEAEKKLGDACEYFAARSAKEYSDVDQNSLKLAADRCRINVMQIILEKMVEGIGQPPKK
jgi:hypothetical protein